MLKITLDYVNFDGQTRQRDLYFNISMKALAEKEVRSDGTWLEALKAISEAAEKDEASGNVIMDRFYEIISLSYGERDQDGEIFRQSPQIWDDFKVSAAFDAFFMKVCTDAEYATKFINAVLPAELIERVKAQAAQAKAQENAGRDSVTAVREVELPQQSPPVVWPPQA